jgi:hypothetical protein
MQAAGPMGFGWARQAFLESLHKSMTVDHWTLSIVDGDKSPKASIRNLRVSLTLLLLFANRFEKTSLMVPIYTAVRLTISY